MAQSHTIGTLTISGWGGKLGLNGSLTIGNGGSMDGSEIINSGDAATLNFALGTFTWSGGSINWDAVQQPQLGYVTISSGAEVDVTGNKDQSLGDSLTNSGLFKFANAGGTLSLYNRPTITNNGTILITGEGGLMVPTTGDPIVTIQNGGTIQSTVNYTIGHAINMASANALLYVQSRILTIRGADPSAGYSLLIPAGTVQVTPSKTAINRITANQGIQQTGGTTKTTVGSTGDAWINTGTKDYVLNGGTLQAGDSTPSTPRWRIGPNNLQFKSGTIQLYYDTNVQNGAWSQVVVDGSIVITQASTTLAVTFLGTSLPNTVDPTLTSRQGNINTTCGTNPQGYNASITGGGAYYTLTRAGQSPILLQFGLDRAEPPHPSSHSTVQLAGSQFGPTGPDGLSFLSAASFRSPDESPHSSLPASRFGTGSFGNNHTSFADDFVLACVLD
jgi:hypothetical protein